MKRFKNILVAIDPENHSPDNAALLRAVSLAHKNGASITLMDVVKQPSGTLAQLAAMVGLGEDEDLQAVMIKERQQQLTELAQGLDEALDIKVHVTAGRDFIELIHHLLESDHDLLMKVANPHDEGFDSNDFHLLRKCPKPVWLIRAKEEPQLKKVMAAVDLSLEEDEQGRALNKDILDLAVSLAAREGCDMHLLSCWSLPGESSLRNSPFLNVASEKMHELLETEKKRYRDHLEDIAERYALKPEQLHLLKGDPVELIPQFARKNKVDVAVMGTVARSGIPGLLIGNTAETVLGEIDSSVLALKPDGFISPVQ